MARHIILAGKMFRFRSITWGDLSMLIFHGFICLLLCAGNMQNCPRQLAMHSCALCLYSRNNNLVLTTILLVFFRREIWPWGRGCSRSFPNKKLYPGRFLFTICKVRGWLWTKDIYLNAALLHLSNSHFVYSKALTLVAPGFFGLMKPPGGGGHIVPPLHKSW